MDSDDQKIRAAAGAKIVSAMKRNNVEDDIKIKSAARVGRQETAIALGRKTAPQAMHRTVQHPKSVM